ncbi:hypothetical protein [Thiothrix lacustris]|uniref:hypothetical protein n=1 Tax=Thiothrix lacustris TaxID=525917 RepID=UPI000A5CB113|nr:hypothetical protein [Thiothrix lacustris]
MAWPIIETALYDTLERARNLWPAAIADLPMQDAHKTVLRTHWQRLNLVWRIG